MDPSVYHSTSRSPTLYVLPMPTENLKRQKPTRRAVGEARKLLKGASLEFIDGGVNGIIEQMRAGL